MAKILLALLLLYLTAAGLKAAFPVLGEFFRKKVRQAAFAPQPNPTYSIVLVHGTFASDAQWIKSDSALCKHLLATIPGPINFFPLNWSGGNSFEARLEATDRLIVLAKEIKAAYPSTPLLVIGHSHGGSIAVSARQRLPHAIIDGIITLSTPFLHIEYDPPRRMERYAIGGIWFAIIAFIAFVYGVFSLSIDSHPGASIELLFSGILVFFALAITNIGALSSRRWGMRLARRSHIDDASAGRTLILRTSSDEASMVIGIMAVVARMTDAIHRLVLGLVDAAENRLGTEHGDDVKAMVVFPIWWSATMLLIALLTPLTVSLAIVANLTVGRVPLIWCRVGAEATPPGRWLIHYVRSIDTSSIVRRPSMLRHSRLYTDPDALGHISDWICTLSRAKLAGTGTGKSQKAGTRGHLDSCS